MTKYFYLFCLFLICTLLSCVHKSGPAPKMTSDHFDSLQVEILEEKAHSDSIEKQLIKAE